MKSTFCQLAMKEHQFINIYQDDQAYNVSNQQFAQ
jgi:hypothetical protein